MPETPEIKCCDKPLEFRLLEGDTWQSYKPEAAVCPSCNTYFERRPGSEVAYRERKDGSFECTTCKEPIMEAKVSRVIHDGPFAKSGGGEVHKEKVSFCPYCETTPHTGEPIVVSRDISYQL